MEIEKSEVLIKFLLNFRQSGDVLFFLNARRLRGYTATLALGGGSLVNYYNSNMFDFGFQFILVHSCFILFFWSGHVGGSDKKHT